MSTNISKIGGVLNASAAKVAGQVLPGTTDAYTKALLHFNGANNSTTFTDDTGRTWTSNGDFCKLDTGNSPKFGSAHVIMAGTDDYISTADHADFKPAGSWTVDCWIKTFSGSDQVIFQSANYYGAYSGFQIFQTSAGKVKCYAGSNESTSITGSTSINDGGYHHIEVSYDSGASLLRIFVDGVSDATPVSCVATTWAMVNNYVTIGIQQDDISGLIYDFSGWIDEFRFSNGIARHTSNFTPESVEYSVVGPSPISKVMGVNNI